MHCDEKKKRIAKVPIQFCLFWSLLCIVRALNELPRAALAEARSLDAPTAMAVALP